MPIGYDWTKDLNRQQYDDVQKAKEEAEAEAEKAKLKELQAIAEKAQLAGEREDEARLEQLQMLQQQERQQAAADMQARQEMQDSQDRAQEAQDIRDKQRIADIARRQYEDMKAAQLSSFRGTVQTPSTMPQNNIPDIPSYGEDISPAIDVGPGTIQPSPYLDAMQTQNINVTPGMEGIDTWAPWATPQDKAESEAPTDYRNPPLVATGKWARGQWERDLAESQAPTPYDPRYDPYPGPPEEQLAREIDTLRARAEQDVLAQQAGKLAGSLPEETNPALASRTPGKAAWIPESEQGTRAEALRNQWQAELDPEKKNDLWYAYMAAQNKESNDFLEARAKQIRDEVEQYIPSWEEAQINPWELETQYVRMMLGIEEIDPTTPAGMHAMYDKIEMERSAGRTRLSQVPLLGPAFQGTKNVVFGGGGTVLGEITGEHKGSWPFEKLLDMWGVEEDPNNEMTWKSAYGVYLRATDMARIASYEQNGVDPALYDPVTGMGPTKTVTDAWGNTREVKSHIPPAMPEDFNWAQTMDYIQAAYNELISATTPTPAQMAGTTPFMREVAKTAAITNAHSGIAAVDKTYDDILDSYMLGDDLTEKASAAYQAAMEQDYPNSTSQTLRNMYLTQAAVYSAEAQRYKNQDVLTAFEENFSPMSAIPFEIIVSPDNLFDLGAGFAAKLGIASKFLSGPAEIRALRAMEAVEGGVTGARVLAEGATGFAAVRKELLDGLKRQVSTARGAAKTNQEALYQGLVILTNPVTAPADAETIVRKFMQDTDGTFFTQGIPISELEGPGLRAMANEFGFYQPGWAVGNNPTIIDARNSMRGFEDRLPTFKSLQGNSPGLDKQLFNDEVADGLQTHASEAVGYSNTQLPEGILIPPGADKVTIVPSTITPGLSSLEFSGHLDGTETVLSSTTEMASATAARVAAQATDAITTGPRITKTPVQKFSDFLRTLTSDMVLNPNGRAIVNNAVGGGLNAAFTGRYGFRRNADYLSRNGRLFSSTGLPPSTRFAGGKAITGEKAYLGGGSVLSKIPVVGDIIRAGKGIRQGSAQIPIVNLQTGEDGMALMIWSESAHEFVRMNWKEKPLVEFFKSLGIQDPKAQKQYAKAVHAAGLTDGAPGVLKALEDIENGNPTFHINQVSPIYGDVLGKEVPKYNALVGQLTGDPNTDRGILHAIDELVDTRITEIEDGFGLGTYIPNYRLYGISEDRLRDIKDYENWRTLAGGTGRTPEVIAKTKEFAKEYEALDAKVAGMMAIARKKPGAFRFVDDAATEIGILRDMARLEADAKMAELSKIPALDPDYIIYRDTIQSEVDDIWNEANKEARYRMDFLEAEMKKYDDSSYDAAMAAYSGGAASSSSIRDRTTLSEALTSDPYQSLAEGAAIDAKSGLWDTLALQARQAAGQKALGDMRERTLAFAGRFNDDVSLQAIRDANTDIGYAYNRTHKAVQDMEERLTDEIKDLERAGASRYKIGKVYDRLYDFRNKAWISDASKGDNSGFFNYSVNRQYAAQLEMLLPEVDEAIRRRLTFTASDGKVYNVRGRWKGDDNYFRVVPDAGGPATRIPASAVPKDVISAYNESRVIQEQMIADLALEYAMDVFPLTGEAIVDNTMKALADPRYNDIWMEMIRQFKEYAAFPAGRTPIDGAEIVAREKKLLQGIKSTTRQVASDIGTANRRAPAVGNGALSRGKREILPFYNSMLQGAQDYGTRMVTHGLLSYNDENKLDAAVGLVMPFFYYPSRMAKIQVGNVFRRPGRYTIGQHYEKEIDREKEVAGDPDRQEGTLPGGVIVGGKKWQFQDPIGRLWPGMQGVLSGGWQNQSMLTSANELLEDVNPLSFDGGAAAIVGAQRLTNQELGVLGLSMHPMFSAVADLTAAVTGKDEQSQLTMADLGPIGNLFGQAAAVFANSPTGKKLGMDTNPHIGPMQATAPWTPYLQGRNVASRAQPGFPGDMAITPSQSVWAQDVMYQDATGEPPLDRQPADAPEIAQQSQYNNALEYFVRSLMTLLGLPAARPIYYGEQEATAAQDQRRNMGAQASPFGSQIAQRAMTDQDQANSVGMPELYSPGLVPWMSKSSVMPRGPLSETTRPGAAQSSREIYGAIDAIDAKLESDIASGTDAWIAAGKDYGGLFTEVKQPLIAAAKEQKDKLYSELGQLPMAPRDYDATLYKSPIENRDSYLNSAYMSLIDMPGKPEYPGENASQSQWMIYTAEKNTYDQAQEDAFVARVLGQADDPMLAGLPYQEQLRMQRAKGEAPNSSTIMPDGSYFAGTLPKMTEEEARNYFRARDLAYYLKNTTQNERVERELSKARNSGWIGDKNQQWEDIRTRMGPEGVTLADQYDVLQTPEERDAFKATHPEMDMVFLAGYNPEVYDAGTQQFGDGVWGEYYTASAAKEAFSAANPYPAEDATQAEIDGYYAKLGEFTQEYPQYKEVQFFLNGRFNWMSGSYAEDGSFVGNQSTPPELWVPDGGQDYYMAKEYWDAAAVKAGGKDLFDIMRIQDTYSAEGKYKQFYTDYPNADGVIKGFEEWKKNVSTMPDPLTTGDLESIDMSKIGRPSPEASMLTPEQIASYRPPTPSVPGQPAPPPAFDPLSPTQTARMMTDVGALPRTPNVPPAGLAFERMPIGPNAPVTGVPPGPLGQRTGVPGVTRPKNDLLPSDLSLEAWPMRNADYANWKRIEADIAARRGAVVEKFGEFGLTGEAWDAYFALPKDSDARKQYKQDNPIVGVALLAGYNPAEYNTAIESGFTVENTIEWAGRPRWTEETSEEYSSWMKGHPQAWRFSAYLNGRPEVIDETATADDFVYDWGKDYNEAKKKFGDNVWSVVMEQKGLGDGTSKEEKKSRALWYEANPQYSSWADWWYAALPDNGTNKSTSAYAYYGGGYGGGYGGYGGGGGGGGYGGYSGKTTSQRSIPSVPFKWWDQRQWNPGNASSNKLDQLIARIGPGKIRMWEPSNNPKSD